MRLQWDQTSLLWATLANANRDPKARPEPFLPSDIHPYRTAAEYGIEENDEPDWAMIAQIRAQNKVTQLHASKCDNQGGGGVP